MKALIPAAGFGSRLRPITDLLPKPLLPFMGKQLIEIAIQKVHSAGFSFADIAINTHHLSEQILRFITAKYPDIKVTYEEDLLGTGGTIRELKSWLNEGREELLVFNSDIITDADLADFIKQHRQCNPQPYASMLIMKEPVAGKNPLIVDPTGRLVSIGKPGSPWHSFTGIHIVTPKMMANIGEGFQDIIQSYHDCLSQGLPIQTFFHDSYWKDLGTPYEYWEAHQSFINLPIHNQKASIQTIPVNKHNGLNNIFVDDSCQIDSNARLHGGTYCFNASEVPAAASLSNCVLYEAKVKAKAALDNTIIVGSTRVSF